MSIIQDAFSQDGLLANEGNSDPGTEAVILHVVKSIYDLDDEVFHLIVGYKELRFRGKTPEDRGLDG